MQDSQIARMPRKARPFLNKFVNGVYTNFNQLPRIVTSQREEHTPLHTPLHTVAYTHTSHAYNPPRLCTDKPPGACLLRTKPARLCVRRLFGPKALGIWKRRRKCADLRTHWHAACRLQTSLRPANAARSGTSSDSESRTRGKSATPFPRCKRGRLGLASRT